MMAAIEALNGEAGDARTAAAAGGRGHRRFILLDLRAASPSRLGGPDGIHIVVKKMPTGARLSAGRRNGNLSWSLSSDELDGLQLILPAQAVCAAHAHPGARSGGYDFASTGAITDMQIERKSWQPRWSRIPAPHSIGRS
jgi:hypothetical protein